MGGWSVMVMILCVYKWSEILVSVCVQVRLNVYKWSLCTSDPFLCVQVIPLPPQIIHFNRVFHYFHHPFWGTTIFGNTYIGVARNLLSRWDFFPGRGRFRAKFVDSFEVNLLQDVRNGRKEWKVRATDSCWVLVPKKTVGQKNSQVLCDMSYSWVVFVWRGWWNEHEMAVLQRRKWVPLQSDNQVCWKGLPFFLKLILHMQEDMGEDLQQNREAHSEGWWTVNPEKAKKYPPNLDVFFISWWPSSIARKANGNHCTNANVGSRSGVLKPIFGNTRKLLSNTGATQICKKLPWSFCQALACHS